MTFSQDASQSGAQPVYLVSVETRRCGLSYGQAPCTAQIGVTGNQPCFNTVATCQDLPNISASGGFFYRFIEPIDTIPTIRNSAVLGVGPFPFLAGSPSFSPSQVDPSGGFGVRASVNISMVDSTHHDIGIDPYVDQRSYDPMETGTFWGKWLARNPFYIGQRVLVELGHINGDGEIDLSNSQRLWYFVESINGPDSSGNISITAKDVLKLADNLRAQCPPPSSGTLLTDIESTTTEFLITPVDDLDQYGPEGAIIKVRIGDEIIRCTREFDQLTVVDESGVLSTLGRGIDGTERDDHREESTVQFVKEFNAQTVPAILEELLTEFATVPGSFVDSVQWADIQSDIGFLFTAQISEPEGVKDLCEQLCRASGAFIYYDEREQLLKLGSIIPTPEINTLTELNDNSSFLQDSVTITRKDDMRLSQVWYFRGLIDSTDSITDPVNYENRLITADLEAETANLYGQKKIEKTWARWTPRENAAAAFVISGRRLNRFKRTPREVRFQLDTKDADIWTNDLVALRHRNLQAATGEEALTPFQVLSVSHTGHSRLSYTALEYDVDQVAEFGEPDTIIIDQDITNVNLRTVYENTIGLAGNAGEVVTVIVLTGVKVRNMIGGGFPVSSVRLINRGDIAGLGGAGGQGGLATSEAEFQNVFPASSGEDGGDAIVMSEDWEILNFGNIYAGAGGGGGGGGAVTTSSPFNAAGGGGGGGGQDLLTSSGGPSGIAIAVDDSANGGIGLNGNNSGPGDGGSGASVSGASSGAGGDGGEWGQDGNSGNAAVSGDETGAFGAGGFAGLAIRTNGNEVTYTEIGNIVGDVL